VRRERHHARDQRARSGTGAARRLGAGQGQVPRHACRGAKARLLLPDRARGRLRWVGHAHHGCAQARQVRDQRVLQRSGSRADRCPFTRASVLRWRRPPRRPYRRQALREDGVGKNMPARDANLA
jgi:hypothetical protein